MTNRKERKSIVRLERAIYLKNRISNAADDNGTELLVVWLRFINALPDCSQYANLSAELGLNGNWSLRKLRRKRAF